MTYYCSDCAAKRGYLQVVDSTNDFTGSIGSYLHNKFSKHTTIPIPGIGIVSIFNSSDYDTYKEYILDTSNSGSVEIDDQNRVNVVWVAHKQIGQTFNQVSKPSSRWI